MERKFLSIEEVAVACKVSVQTINNWYKFKKENPNSEYARLIPEYVVIGGHGQRFWNSSDIPALIEFKQKRPNGCKGVMGSVTQKYVKRGQ